MKYSKEKIVKALLLAPLPLLFFTALLFIIMNREYSLGEFKHEVRQFEKSYDNQQAEQISLMV